MKLSLPLPVYSAPAVSLAAACNAQSSADPVAKNSTDVPSDSFESYLSKDRPIDDPAEKDKDPDAEKAAEMVVAFFGMPVLSPTQPPSLSVNLPVATVQTTPGGVATADTSVCFASPSSRTFGSALPMTGPLRATGTPVAMTKPIATDANKISGAQSPAASTLSPEAATAIKAAPQAPAPLIGSPPVSDLVSALPSASNLPVVAEENNGVDSLDNAALLKALAGSPGIAATGTSVAPKKIVEPSAVDLANAASASNAANGAPGVGTVNLAQPLKRFSVGSTGPAKMPSGSTTAVSDAPATEDGDQLTPVLTADGTHSAKENLISTRNLTASEKFAALATAPDDNSKTSIVSPGKYFLDAGRKLVAAGGASVGIGVAKVNATMSAAATIRLKIPATSDPAAPFIFSGETPSMGTLTVEAPAPVATLRETMAAIISAVEALERRADVQQKSVDLHFTVGNEKLGLRVELRDGTVHATFRTESAEMNTVLAREWHSIVQPVGERGMRLAEPVFTSSVTASGGSDFNSLGQGTPHQREQKAPPSFASVLKPEFYDSGVPESAAKDSPAVTSSQLLNALA